MIDETLTPLESLCVTLYDIGAVKLGSFKLHSGKKSRIYLDLRVLVSFPNALREAAAAYRTVLDKLEYDLLVATPLAGLPIGTALCLDINIPLIYPRKTAKSYGTGKEIEGVWAIGQTAVVVDDLVTSGDSILEAVAAVKAAGLRVKDAVVLIDREQGGTQAMQEQGYKLHAVMTLRQLLSVLVEQDRITAKMHAKVIKSLE
ncbi:MAG: orotate phosphoribosyltransferase [Anaerolineales bacterium]|nr:orotate phosphoribosyltransferase [Anaerolineales bacterium]